MHASALGKRADDALIEDIAGFFNDPLGFVRYAYPWGEPGALADEPGPDEWQTEVLGNIGKALRGEPVNGDIISVSEALRIAVASGHGIGKTALIAWVIQWFISTREFPQIVVTASTQSQLNTKTWRELAKWHRLMINSNWFQWTATKYYHVRYPDTWFASAIPWSESNAAAFAGTHEKYVLVLFDEASAIADVIWETTEGALTTPNAIWLVFGNYTKNTGRFNECFAGRTRSRWLRFQIDSRNARKANHAQIQQWIDDYGEDSDFVRIRVRGVAPRLGSNQFISQELVDNRYIATGYETAPKILSLDVARFGDNQSIAGLRQGRRFTIEGKWRGLASDQLVDRFIEVIDRIDPDAIVVDGDGLGGPVVDFIRRRNYHLRHKMDILTEFHGGPTANNRKLYSNRRTEIWAEAREALKNGIEHPHDPEMDADLVGPEYTFKTRDGIDVMALESKEDMRGRGIASPDHGDAFAMTFAVKVQARKPAAVGEVTRPLPLSSTPSSGWMGL